MRPAAAIGRHRRSVGRHGSRPIGVAVAGAGRVSGTVREPCQMFAGELVLAHRVC